MTYTFHILLCLTDILRISPQRVDTLCKFYITYHLSFAIISPLNRFYLICALQYTLLLTYTTGDTPQAVIDMITSCWDKDRSKRKTAAQCITILEEAIKKYKVSTE